MKTTGSNLKQTPPAPARGKSAGRNAQVVVEESHGGIGGRGRSSPPDKPQINWTAARVARLGKEGDTSLARSLGVRMVVVRRKRLELGVPKYQKVEWTPELIAKLGQDCDNRIARLLGVSTRTVAGLRQAEAAQGVIETVETTQSLHGHYLALVDEVVERAARQRGTEEAADGFPADPEFRVACRWCLGCHGASIHIASRPARIFSPSSTRDGWVLAVDCRLVPKSAG